MPTPLDVKLRDAWRDHRLMVLACGLIVVVLAFAAVTVRLFIRPRQDVPDRADAVVVLAGGSGERLERAAELMDAGVSDTLVVSTGVTWFDTEEGKAVEDFCLAPPSRYEVVCIRPEPDSTKGEAVTISAEAHRRGWSSIALVTSDYHLSRSVRWFSRCFDGSVHPVAAEVPVSFGLVVHEWLGSIDQLILDRSCD